ncbi:acyltransferase family protein [Maricaulis salignorans]|uniref:acyltransferase family protein n=1 Tax=Maricaulis salignorans TaxID=144026 RepID=UPI003A8CF5F8
MSKQIEYRPDIDGLRAFAVSVVVLYHVGLNSFSGGFIGVDVFFVISGYLITGIIQKQALSERGFSFTNFWSRRAKRLLPVLFFVLFSSTIAAYALFPEDLRLDYLSSAKYATLSLANVYFFINSDYFDASSTLRPLLHTWSLGVEEQFYIFWPILIIAISQRARVARLAILAVLGVASFLTAELAVSGVYLDSSAAFYLTPFRVFEFCIGAIAFEIGSSGYIRRSFHLPMLIVGVVGLSAAVLVIDESVAFPSWSALIVSVATALIIFDGRNWVSRSVFGNVAVVYLGKISYALYLVHWPIIVFYNYMVPGQNSALEIVALLASMLLISVILHHGLENPVRYRVFAGNRWTPARVLGVILGGAFAIYVLLGLLAWSLQGHADDADVQAASADAPIDVRAATQFCVLGQDREPSLDRYGNRLCAPEAETRILTIGNSHEMHLYRLLRTLFLEQINAMDVGLVYGSTHARDDVGCDFGDNADLPLSTPSARCAGLATALNDMEQIAQQFDVIAVTGFLPFTHSRIYLDYAAALQSLNPDIRIVVLGSFANFQPYRCPDLARSLGSANACLDPQYVSYFDPNERHAISRAWPELEFFYIDQVELLCTTDSIASCNIELAGQPVIRDANHFTLSSMQLVIPAALQSGLNETLFEYMAGRSLAPSDDGSVRAGMWNGDILELPLPFYGSAGWAGSIDATARDIAGGNAIVEDRSIRSWQPAVWTSSDVIEAGRYRVTAVLGAAETGTFAIRLSQPNRPLAELRYEVVLDVAIEEWRRINVERTSLEDLDDGFHRISFEIELAEPNVLQLSLLPAWGPEVGQADRAAVGQVSVRSMAFERLSSPE